MTTSIQSAQILSKVHKLLSDNNEKFKLLLESGTDARAKEKSILESYLATELLIKNMVLKMTSASQSSKDSVFSNVKLNDLDELLDEIESETKQDTKSLDYKDSLNPSYESLPQSTKAFINEPVNCVFCFSLFFVCFYFF